MEDIKGTANERLVGKTIALKLLICATCLALAGCAPPRSSPPATQEAALLPPASTIGTADLDSVSDEDESEPQSAERVRRKRKGRSQSPEEQPLNEAISEQEISKSPASSIRALLSLARFYRVHRRMKDAVSSLERAYDATRLLSDSPADLQLKGVTCAQLGDIYMRVDRIERALELYEEAMQLLPEGADEGECQLRIYPRIAWALRRSGDTKEAAVVARKAAEQARQKLGDQSPLYRVGLAELAVLALDTGDRPAFARLQNQLDQLETRHNGPFAKTFLRSCVRQCRHDKQPEQAKFVDQQAHYFGRQ